jgi:hypothetical protein
MVYRSGHIVITISAELLILAAIIKNLSMKRVFLFFIALTIFFAAPLRAQLKSPDQFLPLLRTLRGSKRSAPTTCAAQAPWRGPPIRRWKG